MMRDGNDVTKSDGGSKDITNKVTTTEGTSKKNPHTVTTTDEALKDIPDIGATTDKETAEIPDPVSITDEGTQEGDEDEFVHVPTDLKRFVIGMGGIVIKAIQQTSGAIVVPKPWDEEGFTVTGNEEQRASAKRLIIENVEKATTRKESQLNKISYYIDEWNLPVDCKLKLEQIAKEDRIVLPESYTQYQIKPAKAEEFYSATDDPSYMSELKDDTLESLRRIKSQMETKRHLKAEIRCQFGKVIICRRIEDDEEADTEWTIEEATNNLRGSQWRTIFKAGANLNENVLQEHAFDKTPKAHEDYSSRFDFTFLMPNGQQINLWVWVTKKNLGKRLEDIRIPLGYIQNILEEIHFKDEITRSRCRGWLVLPPQTYLQTYLRTDILFPGCEFDFRLTITGHSDRSLEADRVPDEDTRRILARYVSELTFVEEDRNDDNFPIRLRLPEENFPNGFQLSHMKCCERALYGFMPGFTIVLSKEISQDCKTANSRDSTAFYLPCDDWEDLLNNGEWEPEALVKRLPDFFRFVRKVQSVVVCEMKEKCLVQKDKYDFVPVPKDLIGCVIGRGGRVIKEIQKISGARVFSPQRDTEGFQVIGNEEQRGCAKRLILEKVAGRRKKCDEKGPMKLCYYIDEWNLPANCKLQLEKVVQEVPRWQEQYKYRLKPAEVYGPQGPGSTSGDSSYLAKLMDDVLEPLHKIKDEMKTNAFLKADMWCHCGTVLIHLPSEGSDSTVPGIENKWDIKEAINKLQPSSLEDHWRAIFNGGVKVDEKLIEEHILDKTPEEYDDYASRYDLAFMTPSGQVLRFKVWVTKKDLGKKAEDIPIPSTDVANILHELHFKDETTRSRCRGWLILPLRQYMRANILFPGCEFDCRLTIRGRTDNALDNENTPKEDKTNALSEYLSELTFADGDDFGLRLPKRDLPSGFYLSYMRRSERAQYGFTSEFSIILSKESSYQNNVKTDEARVSRTDVHLRCKEWDELFNSENWEPDAIVKKLPEFFRFVKKIQSCVLHELKETGSEKTVPPEILARGRSALDAYRKALADGKTSVRMVPIMFIGQDRAGKTSLKKSLKGMCFDPEENSTVGIDVDPSHFKVTTETWRTGTTDNDNNSNEVISFEFQTAQRVAGSLKKGSKVTKDSINFSPRNHNSELTEIALGPRSTEPSEDDKGTQIPSDSAPTLSKDVPQRSHDPKEGNKKEHGRFSLHVPEEVATATETLLQSECEDNKEEIYSTFWDFAGQSVYYETHPLFLTKRAIYCLVYNLSLDPFEKAAPLVKQGLHERFEDSFNLKTNMDYLDFWMMSVACLTNTQKGLTDEGPRSDILPKTLPPVFLVCTHADKPYKTGNPKDLSRTIFGYLREKPYGSQLVDFYVVDNTRLSVKMVECPEVQRLRQDVREVAKALPHLNEAIPIKWLKCEKALRALTEEGDKWITFGKAKRIASSECSINEGRELETLMNYLHDLRSLIHFDDTPALNELVVLDSQWLIDVFKKVITVKPYDDHRDTKFEELWHKLERKGILDGELLEHLWGTLCNSKETYESLIGIMEKFSLLCSWPSYASKTKRFLVPSMLRTPPPEDVNELVASAKIPPLFVTFETGQVPPGLFPRLILQFYQWATEHLPCSIEPQLYHGFARFFTSDDDECSVILLCHLTFLEIVVHGVSTSFVEVPSSKMTLPTHLQRNTAGVGCVDAVRRQLSLMLKSMCKEFFWLRDVTYEMCVLCPVCCLEVSVKYCSTHHRKRCEQQQCLDFFTLSELRRAKKFVICKSPGFAGSPRVEVKKFSPWLEPADHQELHPTPPPGTSQGVAALGISHQLLKVTLLASEWGSSMGGLSTLNRKLAIVLAKHNEIEVTVLVPQYKCGEEDKRQAKEHNVTIQEAQKLPGYDSLDWLSFPPKDLVIDIVLGHGTKLGKQAQVIRDSHHCKWVQVVHTAPEQLGMHKDCPEAISRGEEKNQAEVDLCELADLVVAVGPKLRDAYASQLRSSNKDQDIIELTPGIFHEFSTTKQAPLDGDNFKVLIFGRGDPEDIKLKGYDVAAKAVAKLRDTCLVFVGAPHGKHKDISDYLVECGISKDQLVVRRFDESREKLKKQLCEADLAIMPSRTEGFGLTALEALSAGLPILVSGNSGFGKVVRKLPSGESHVVETDDPVEWAKAIASVRQKDRTQRLQETQALQASYEEKYSWEDQCDALVKRMLDMVHDTPK